jgi:hypothetical protein
VDKIAVIEAIFIEAQTLLVRAGMVVSCANHLVVNPCKGKAITVLSLNAKSGNNTIGA